jgi:geranylgeranyl reductase family protein
VSYDVVVVGAGPAGSATAYRLASHGVKVAILDRAAFPRDKACGDMLSEGALNQLRSLGLQSLIDQHQSNQIWHAEFISTRGRSLYHDVATHADPHRAKWATIPRVTLDVALVERAQQAGATLFERATAQHVTTWPDRVELSVTGQRNTISTRLVIWAVGSVDNSGPDQSAYFAVRGYYAGRPMAHQLVLDWRLPTGYIWQFPGQGDLYNIGLYTTRECARKFNTLNALKKSPLTTDRTLIGTLRGGMVNTSFGKLPSHGERLLRVGDAAGLVLPHLGEGIKTALQSAEIAVKFTLKALTEDRLSAVGLAGYSRLLHQAFENEFRFSRLLTGLLSKQSSWQVEWLIYMMAVRHQRIVKALSGA